MIVITKELRTELTQQFDLDLDIRYNVKEIKPYLLMYNAPSGTFTISIEKNNIELFSSEFDSQDIKEFFNTEDDYIHGNFSIPCSLLLEKGSYIVKLNSTGYTYNQSSFLGWNKDWQGFFWQEITPRDLDRPLNLRMITNDNQNFKLS